MKKRLLALALCLVMVSSLLPISAAAYTEEQMLSWIEGITANGTYCGDTYFTISVPNDMELGTCSWIPVSNGGEVNLDPDNSERYKLPAGSGAGLVSVGVKYNGSSDEIEHGHEFFIKLNGLTIHLDHDWSAWASNGDGTHSRSCENGCVEPPQTEFCADNNADCKCDDCGASMHNWQLTPTDSSLTFTCGNPGCTIGTVGVAITAHSVTLPDSPFNAQVETTGAFKEAFSGVEISDIRYDYEDSEGVWHQDIDPIPANAKAGRYQAGVCVSGFSGNGGAAARAFSTDDGFNAGGESVFLWVQYTAADPKVTAQTGDNRPIELMMGSVVLFSALAAAAFVADSKRRSRQ